MSDTKATASSGGIGVFGLLGVVFVTLKLLGITEVATWSWWWVTLPFWGMFALILALLGIALAFAGIVAAVVGALDLWNSRQRQRRRKALEAKPYVTWPGKDRGEPPPEPIWYKRYRSGGIVPNATDAAKKPDL